MQTSHEKNCYNTKIICTNSHIEIWKYDRPIRVGRQKRQADPDKKREKRGYERVNDIVRRRKYYKNRREEIRRIVDLNFDERTSFLTLTQAPEVESRMDIKVSNYCFDKFIRRLKYYLGKKFPGTPLKYLATWERTESGVIHYHVILFSFPFIPAKTLEEIWGLGFIKVNKIKGIEAKRRGSYISKYFTKDIDQREYKTKAYFRSRNLKVPVSHKYFIPDEVFDPNMFGEPSYMSQYQLLTGQDYPVDVNYYLV